MLKASEQGNSLREGNRLLSEVAKQAPEIHRELCYYTIPIIAFRGPNQYQEDYQGICSSVFVKIAERYFLLTAGHCVEDFKNNHLFIKISDQNGMLFYLGDRSRVNQSYAKDFRRGIDWGYYEVPSILARTIQAHQRFPLSAGRIDVGSGDTIKEKISQQSTIIFGYPNSMIEQTDEGTMLTNFFIMLNNPLPGKVAEANGIFDVPSQCINFHGKDEDIYGPAGDTMAMPLLKGMSGCGCWCVDFVDFRDSYQDGKFRLIAIHTAEGTITDGSGEKFIRELLIGHWLRKIADDYLPTDSSLSEFIFMKWPALRDDMWKVA